MKKLMIAAAALAVGFVANAAIVDWSYSITKDKTATKGQTSPYATDYAVYVFAADAVADWSKLEKATLDEAIDSSAIAWKVDTERNGTTYATKDEGGVAGNARAIDVGEKSTVDLMYVIVNTKANTYALQQHDDLATRGGGDSPGTAGVFSDVQTDFAALSFASFAGGPGPGPVPEPTSGLLLLLGVAGLSLRRKQK